MAKKKLEREKKQGIKIVKAKQFHVNVVAPNGNNLTSSETFQRKQSAFKNIIAAGKLYADVMSGKTGVTDEHGCTWVLQKNGKFKNTTKYLRKALTPMLKDVAKHVNATSKKVRIVVKGNNVSVVKKKK